MMDRLIKEAFETWVGNSNGVQPTVALKEAFEAGWNAARAEPRSDAASPTGGRMADAVREAVEDVQDALKTDAERARD